VSQQQTTPATEQSDSHHALSGVTSRESQQDVSLQGSPQVVAMNDLASVMPSVQAVNGNDDAAPPDGPYGRQCKSALFDGLDSPASWQNKSPECWVPNDVVLWLEHNSISQQSIQSIKGKLKIRYYVFKIRNLMNRYLFFVEHSTDGSTLMEIARNGLDFVKLSLERDFKIGNILEQAKLTRLIIQLFPELNPHLNRAHGLSSSSLSYQSEHMLQDCKPPGYEEM
jgi:hypothetical protein